MDKKITGRGGPGRGQGRKPAAPEVEAMVQVNVMLHPAQKEKLKRLGGAPWVRQKIDQAKEWYRHALRRSMQGNKAAAKMLGTINAAWPPSKKDFENGYE